MSRSDDPAHWDDAHATPEQNAQHEAYSNTPHSQNPHSQPINPDPYSQPAHQVPPTQVPPTQVPPTQAHPTHIPPTQVPQTHQTQAHQTQAAPDQPHPDQPGETYYHPDQYAAAQQPAAQHPGATQPGAGHPPAGQPADPYGQTAPQGTYSSELDILASQIEASQASAAQKAGQPGQNPHTPQSHYTGAADPHAQPHHQPVDHTEQYYADPAAAPYAPPQQAAPDQSLARQTASELNAYYDQQQQAPAPGYDLGGLMQPDPAPVPQTATGDHFRAGSDLPSQHAEVDFGQSPAANPAAQQPHTGDIGHLAEHFTQGPGGDQHSIEPGLQTDAGFYDNQYENDEYEKYEESSSRFGGFFKLVATLLLAVITGGGLAYGYKYYVASGGKKNVPAIIRADSNPAKIRPKTPGGKKFAHSKKAIYERVGGPAKPVSASNTARVGANDSATAGSGANNDAIPGISLSGNPPPAVRPNNGARKVKTVSVRPDGTFEPSKPLRPSAPADIKKLRSQSASVSIPGITMDAAPKPAASVKKTLTDELVKQVSRAKPQPAKPPKVKPIAKKPPVKIARAEPARVAKPAAPAAVRTGTSPNGYVSQISSRKSRIDALSAFADLRQRYGSILGKSQPDIQEANLGARGLWYRLRVGPPSSKQAATELCNKLKSAGHKGCFVRAY